MASLIPGYEYDIFISYRQKDNKYDGWVTEFVANLKKEIEATFKEDVSVYFDINPHDGLLETHDVDASLKEKLKCLIFIPIISRTYCDPKSFAWEHEFKAFVEQASKEQLGLKVRLPNGNVANRVLPVQIHELDADDRKLVESELGGFLRGIEFIYKEHGVNRPLLSNEDHPDNNINKTYYRNQINKVANAIKEIITGLKNPGSEGQKSSKIMDEKKPMVRKNLKPKIIAGSFLLLALIVAGYFIISKLIKPAEQLEKSIAVLPFRNFSKESDQESMSFALTDGIICNLFKIRSFDKVVPLNSVWIYKGKEISTTQIAKELNINYIVEGTYTKIEDQVIISVKLIDAKGDKIIWQDKHQKPYKEIIAIQADIPLQIADQLKTFLTSSEKQSIQKISTTSLKAYELVQNVLYRSRTEVLPPLNEMFELIKEAIKLDPNYADAQALAGMTIIYHGTYSGTKGIRASIWDAQPYFDKALEIDPDNLWAHFGKGNINEYGRWNYIEAEQEYKKSIGLQPNNFESDDKLYVLGEFYEKMNRLEDALIYLKRSRNTALANPSGDLIRISEMQENKKEAYKLVQTAFPESNREQSNHELGELFIWLADYDSARVCLESAVKQNNLFMQLPRFQACLALANFKTGNYQKAGAIIRNLIDKGDKKTAGSPDYFTGWYYSGIGELDTAFYWLEKAYKNNSPEFPWLKVDPVFTSLKKDPRYWDLYERTGHKAYDDYIAGMKK